jgi:hypothetical protein
MIKTVSEHTTPPVTISVGSIAAILSQNGVNGETKSIIVAGIAGIFLLVEGVAHRGVKGEIKRLKEKLTEMGV